MKNLSKLLPLFIFSFLISCGKTEDIKIEPEVSQLNIISYDHLKTSTKEIYVDLYRNGNSFAQEYDGMTYYNMESLMTPAGFEYYKSRIIISSQQDIERQNMSKEQKANEYILSGIEEIGLSDEFHKHVNGVLDFMDEIDSKTFFEAEEFFISSLKIVENSSDLNEEEKFTLSQILYNSLAIIESSFEVEEENLLANGRLQRCPGNWRVIASDALKAGLANGVRVGIQGVRAGATATLPSGNPIVGGAVGGFLGFTIGFVTGSALGGGASLFTDCLLNESKTEATPFRAVSCNGVTFFTFSVSNPIGCIDGCSDLSPKCIEYHKSTIRTIPLVPNYGKATLNPYITKAINSYTATQ